MYIVLADDLTGAMDTGIQFRKYGIQTSVIVSADDCELRGDSCAGAVSINNSSRELSGSEAYEKTLRAVHRLSLSLWGDRIFEKCGIRRDEEGDGGKTLEIRGKRRLSARDGGANYQQS